MDGELLTKIFFGAISGFVLMWLGPKILRLISPRIKEEATHVPISIPLHNEITIDTVSFSEQKKTLLELKNKYLLTESEYEEKLMIIESREQELILKQKKVDLLKEQKQQAKQLIKKLEDFHKSGILTQKEFEEKKDQVYSDYMKKYLENPLQIIDYSRLTEYMKTFVQNQYIKYNGTCIILYNKPRNIMCSFNNMEFYDLIMGEKISEYFYVILPKDFNANLKK